MVFEFTIKSPPIYILVSYLLYNIPFHAYWHDQFSLKTLLAVFLATKVIFKYMLI